MGERLLIGFGADSIKNEVAMATESSHWLIIVNGENDVHADTFSFDPNFVKPAANENSH